MVVDVRNNSGRSSGPKRDEGRAGKKKRNAAPRRHLVEVQVSRQKRQRKGKLLRMEGSAFSTKKKKDKKIRRQKKNRVWVMMIFLLKRDRC